MWGPQTTVQRPARRLTVGVPVQVRGGLLSDFNPGCMMPLASVPCAVCKVPFVIDQDELRERCDTGNPPPCNACVDREAAADVEREKAALVAAEPGPDYIAFRRRLTAADVILCAAAGLEAGGMPVSMSRLVVAAWTLDRQRFGLAGYVREYPSDNRVIAEVVKMARPVSRGPGPTAGTLDKIGVKLYAVSDYGRRRYAAIKLREPRPCATTVTPRSSSTSAPPASPASGGPSSAAAPSVRAGGS